MTDEDRDVSSAGSSLGNLGLYVAAPLPYVRKPGALESFPFNKEGVLSLLLGELTFLAGEDGGLSSLPSSLGNLGR